MATDYVFPALGIGQHGEETWILGRKARAHISVRGLVAMKKLVVAITLVAVLLVGASALYAGSSIYGVSGLIETPDGSIAAQSSLALDASYISDVGGSDSLTTYGGAFGLMPKLEIGGVAIDSDAAGVKTRGLLNAKYQIMGESLEKPSITVGVVDVADQLDKINGRIGDPSAFIVFGKNISTTAEGISGNVSKPIRGTLGFGTGLYKGGFAGLSMAATSKLDFMLEYLSNGIRQDSTVNAAAKLKLARGLAIQAGTLDFNGLYAGASYSLSTY